MTFRVPRPKPGYDVKSLPLRPADAFLLSRIDGALTERDLALLTGMSHGDVIEALRRLRELGAIQLDGESTQEPGPRAAARRAPAAESGKPPLVTADPSARSALADAPPPYDPAELDEEIELGLDRKRRILDLYYRLEDLSYYELLGIADQADKKQIKSAYYQLAPEFHPDTYFRKHLGSYKAKIEAIFTRITLAHDTLTSKQRRVEYDQYLEQTNKNRAMAALIDQTPRDIATAVSSVDETVRAVVADPRDAGASRGRYASERDSAPGAAAEGFRPPPADDGAAQGRGTSPQRPPARPATPSPAATPPLTMKERRETFARKLSGGLRRSSGTQPAAVTAPVVSAASGEPTPESARAAEALKARYDAAQGEALRNQIERYTDMGRVALERKDFAGAANAFRIAASLAPEDAEIRRESAEVQRLAAAALADGYLKQARYESEQGRWVDAALSYAKVCNGRPDDASAHERVAYAALQSGGNMRRAAEFARRAVELAPDSVEFRLTLALVYAAAGFEKSATGEIDRAAELARNDARMRDLVAQTREQAKKNGKQA
jgi:curved DNA-binding protein CbpA